MVAELSTYDLPEDYWDGYRSEIGAVSADAALQAAAAHIDPVNALVVIVGDASRIESELQPYGPVTVVDAEGEILRTLPEPFAPPRHWHAEPCVCTRNRLQKKRILRSTRTTCNVCAQYSPLIFSRRFAPERIMAPERTLPLPKGLRRNWGAPGSPS